MLLRYSSLSFIFIGCLMHLFCCGIPSLMALTSLATILGVSTGSFGQWQWYEEIEAYVLAGSGILLLFSIVSYGVSRYMNCSTQQNCSHGPCEQKKDYYRLVLIAVAIIYMLNLTLYFLA